MTAPNDSSIPSISTMNSDAQAIAYLKQHYPDLEPLYTKKLWHQLTDALIPLQNSVAFTELFQNVILTLHDRISPIAYAKLGIAAHTDVERLQKDLENKADYASSQALLLVRAEKLRTRIKADILEELQTLKEDLEKSTGVLDNDIFSSVYRAQMEYYKLKGPAQDYFSNALLFLTYKPILMLPEDDQLTLAVDVGTAALLGHNIYNFGELLQHPIVSVLRGTHFEWLSELLTAFNTGDILAFESAYAANKSKQAVLNGQEDFLREKIRIMALLDAVFRRPSTKRTLTFDEVAVTTKLPLDQVEWLLMKALSRGVIRGSIDEVERTVRITYIQPRVLDAAQARSLRERLQTWNLDLDKHLQLLETHGADVLSSE